MFARKLRMMLRDREVAVLGAVAILTLLMWLGFLGHLGRLWRFYLSPSYRREALTVLTKLKTDTGWGLSNFNIIKTGCTKSSCDLMLDFAYHGRPSIKPPHATFELNWPIGKPEMYEVHTL